MIVDQATTLGVCPICASPITGRNYMIRLGRRIHLSCRSGEEVHRVRYHGESVADREREAADQVAQRIVAIKAKTLGGLTDAPSETKRKQDAKARYERERVLSWQHRERFPVHEVKIGDLRYLPIPGFSDYGVHVDGTHVVTWKKPGTQCRTGHTSRLATFARLLMPHGPSQRYTLVNDTQKTTMSIEAIHDLATLTQLESDR